MNDARLGPGRGPWRVQWAFSVAELVLFPGIAIEASLKRAFVVVCPLLAAVRCRSTSRCSTSDSHDPSFSVRVCVHVYLL